MNKILLCALNSQFVHSNSAVHSLKCSAYCYAEKFSVDFPDTSIKEFSINDTPESILFFMNREKADIVAFSVYIWNCTYIAKLCRILKKARPGITIILGGPQVSYGLDSTDFAENDYDFIICGEGERAFFSLISSITSNGFVPPPEWKFNLENKKCSCADAENLDEFPFPYSEENIGLFDNRIIYYESSRGCPFRCEYCLSSVCGKVRTLSEERIKSDLKFFIEHSVRQVKFVDRTFNWNPKRANEIWKFLIENSNGVSTNFHFEISADILTEDNLKILSSAPDGLFRIEAGIQSFNEKTLKESGRKTDFSKLCSNIKSLCENNNMTVHADLIAGLPYEDASSFRQTFDRAYSLKPHQLQLGFLKLLPGAPLNAKIKKHGYVFSDSPPYEIIKNNYIGFDELAELKKFEYCFERIYNSSRFIFSLSELEKHFSSPFEMFLSLSSFFENSGLLFRPVSTKNLYCALHDFCNDKCVSDISLKDFDKLLLLDYFSCERSEQIPTALKYLLPPSGKQKEIRDLLKIKNNLSSALRFIDGKIYIFDYSAKNPVNERYTFTQIEKF